MIKKTDRVICDYPKCNKTATVTDLRGMFIVKYCTKHEKFSQKYNEDKTK
jgi:hypothetical protein